MNTTNQGFDKRLKDDVFEEATKLIGEILAISERNFELVRPELRIELEEMIRKEFKAGLLGFLKKFKHDQLIRNYNLGHSKPN